MYMYSFLCMNIDISFWKIGMIYKMITNFRIMCLLSPNISKKKKVYCEIGLDCNGIRYNCVYGVRNFRIMLYSINQLSSQDCHPAHLNRAA